MSHEPWKSPPLPLWALARATDPQTSHDAAASVSDFAGEHHRKILNALAAGPGTADEIGDRCGLHGHKVGKRLGEMRRAGMVTRLDETRAGKSGRQMHVYAAASKAEESQ